MFSRTYTFASFVSLPPRVLRGPFHVSLFVASHRARAPWTHRVRVVHRLSRINCTSMASPYARCPPLVDLEAVRSRGNTSKQCAIEARLRLVPMPHEQTHSQGAHAPPPGFERALPRGSVDDWIDTRDDDDDDDLDDADWPHEGDGWDT